MPGAGGEIIGLVLGGAGVEIDICYDGQLKIIFANDKTQST